MNTGRYIILHCNSLLVEELSLSSSWFHTQSCINWLIIGAFAIFVNDLADFIWRYDQWRAEGGVSGEMAAGI